MLYNKGYQKKWKVRKKEHVLKYQREYYHRVKNRPGYRAKRNAQRKRWYQKNREKMLAAQKRYYPVRLLKIQQLRVELKEKIVHHYGNRCNCCDLKDTRFLTVDHVDNGKHNPLSRKERKEDTLVMYKRIIAKGYPKEYQILCMNCNWAKGMYGKCFHQWDKESLGKSVSERV
jgi:hypothetical protein